MFQRSSANLTTICKDRLGTSTKKTEEEERTVFRTSKKDKKRTQQSDTWIRGRVDAYGVPALAEICAWRLIKVQHRPSWLIKGLT